MIRGRNRAFSELFGILDLGVLDRNGQFRLEFAPFGLRALLVVFGPKSLDPKFWVFSGKVRTYPETGSTSGNDLFFCLLWMIRYNVVSAMHFQIEMYSLCISLKLKVNKLHRVMESENGLYMRFKQFHSTLVYLTKVMCVFWCVALIFISVSPHKRCNLCTCQWATCICKLQIVFSSVRLFASK